MGGSGSMGRGGGEEEKKQTRQKKARLMGRYKDEGWGYDSMAEPWGLSMCELRFNPREEQG